MNIERLKSSIFSFLAYGGADVTFAPPTTGKVSSQLFEPTPCLSLAVKDEQKCYCFFHHSENYTASLQKRAEFSHSQSTTSAVRPSIRADRRKEAGAGGRKLSKRARDSKRERVREKG